MISIEEEWLREREIAEKFTIKFANLTIEEKNNLPFTEAPCNIWGYIQKLEERIIKLEEVKVNG